MNRQKTERNKLLVQLIDKGWSYSRVASELKLKAKSTVHEIYHREKNRSDKIKLSTRE